MSAPSDKLHRRCVKCDHIHRTSAKKGWKCPLCGTRNYIKRAKAIKPPRKTWFIKKGMDMYTKPEEAA